MSTVEEDTELRDLLIEKLKANGTLDKIRAQLRASVFLALEEHQHEKPKKPIKPLVNEKAASFVATSEGETCAQLIKEFLEFFDLRPSLSVFEPDCGLDKRGVSRTELAREIGVDATDKLPLLALLLRKAQEGPTHSHREQRLKDNYGGFEKPKTTVPAGVPPLALGLRDDKSTKQIKLPEKSDLIVDDEDDDFFQKPPSLTTNNLMSQLKDSAKSTLNGGSSPASKPAESRPKDPNSSTLPSKPTSSGVSSILGDLPQLGVKKSLPPLGFGSPQPALNLSSKTDSGSKVKVPMDLFDNDVISGSEDEKTPDISDSTDRSDRSRSKKGASGDALDLILSGGKAKLQDKLPPMKTAVVQQPKDLPVKPDELSRGVSTEDDISEEIPEDIEGETTSQKSAANSF